MQFRIQCPHCLAAFKLSDPRAEQVYPCPQCQGPVKVGLPKIGAAPPPPSGTAPLPARTEPPARKLPAPPPPPHPPAPPPVAPPPLALRPLAPPRPAREEAPLPLGKPKRRPSRSAAGKGKGKDKVVALGAGGLLLVLGGFLAGGFLLGPARDTGRQVAAGTTAAEPPAPAVPDPSAAAAEPKGPPAPAEPAEPQPIPPGPPAEPAPAPRLPPADPPSAPPVPAAVPPADPKNALSLPSPATRIFPAAGGNLLLFYLPQQRQVAVLDVPAGRVVKYLPLPDDNVQLAAGRDHLFVFLPEQGLIQRWSLVTLERDRTAPWTLPGRPLAAAMGAAVPGPLVVVTDHPRAGRPIHALDPETLQAVPLEDRTPEEPLPALRGQADTLLTASANGLVYCLGHRRAVGLTAFTLTGTGLTIHPRNQAAVFGVPSPDGRLIFTNAGLFTVEGRRIYGDAREGRSQIVAALAGGTYLRLFPALAPYVPGDRTLRPVERVEFYWPGTSQTLATLTDVPGLEQPVNPDPTHLHLRERVWYHQGCNRLVVLSYDGDRVFLVPLDLEAALTRANGDFLLVTSSPPALFRRGQDLAYDLTVWSRNGGLTYRVEAGPPGLTVSPAGQVRWRVPADFGDTEVNVILTVRDAKGQEVFHTFRLTRAGATGDVASRPPAARPDRPARPKAPGENPAAPAAPPAPAGPLTPTELALPGAVQDACAGGAGRFLILHFPQQRQLGVFDATTGRIAKFLPLADDNVVFAAGRSKVFVVYPDRGQVQRWSLTTFEKEATQNLPGWKNRVTGAALGAAADGPLVLVGPEAGAGHLPCHLFDPGTLREVTPAKPAGKFGLHFDARYPPAVRASPDGHVLALWRPGLSPAGIQTVILGSSPRGAYEHTAADPLLPGADGKILYTRYGLYTLEGVKLGGGPENAGPATLPAAHGPFYLTLDLDGPGAGRARTDGQRGIGLHLAGDARPLLTIPFPKEMEKLPAIVRPGGGVTYDRRLFLLPSANLLVAIPDGATRLLLYRCNLEDILEKSGRDYLVVTSQPPPSVARGQPYQYAITARSKKGGIKYKLEAGPKGMRVGSDGVVTWQVPDAWAEAEVPVLVSLKDAAGLETYHSFKITVSGLDQVAAGPAPRPPDLPGGVPGYPGGPPRAEVPGPAADPGPAAPAAAAPVERPLPATAADVCVGGAGRFLILHLPQERRLAIFDALDAKVVKYLSFPDGDLRFAAGRDHLIVALPDQNVLQRWSLATFEREAAVTCPVAGTVVGLAMGSASRGPLLVSTRGNDRFPRGAAGTFVDPLTFRTLELDGAAAGQLGNAPELVRASPDGSLFTFRPDVGGEPHGMTVVQLTGTKARVKSAGVGASLLLPATDNRYLYSADGIYTPDLELAFPKTRTATEARSFLPARQGPFFLRLEPAGDPFRSGLPGQPAAGPGKVALMLPGLDRPVTFLNGIDGLGHGLLPYGGDGRQRLHYDKRVHLLPAMNLLVTIPATNDRLLLYRFDLDDLLAKADVDYLFVTSQPPPRAVRGETLSYQVVVRSRKGGVRYQLAGGPEGMVISAAGKVTWAVPAGFADQQAEVLLTVTDQSGQEVFHSFRLAVADPERPPAP